MPDLDGLEVARRTRDKSPAPESSSSPCTAASRSCWRRSDTVSGYVLKGSATGDLIAAVHAAMADKRFLSASLNERALEAYARRAEDAARSVNRCELLTSREREVLAGGAGDGQRRVGTFGDFPSPAGVTGPTCASSASPPRPELVRFAVGRGLDDG